MEQRTALAYQFDIEYDLAVRMVVGRDAAVTDADARRLLRAWLWGPYRLWRERATDPVRLPGVNDDEVYQALAVGLPPALRESLGMTLRFEDLREYLKKLLDKLADPETFRERLVTEGWTSAYPLVTREMRPHSPILKWSESDEAYQWQFDFRGVRLRTDVEMPVMLEASQWRQQIFFIRSAQAKLQRVTGEKVHFGTLGSGINIIPSSPEWSEVQAAITRLQQADASHVGAPERDPRDLAVVGQFATLISRQGETIALAVACAAIVAEAVGQSDPPTTLASGLSAIARSFGLAAGERRPPIELLKVLGQSAAERWPDLPRDLLRPLALEPGRVQEWGDWIQGQMRAAGNIVDAHLADTVEGAWAALAPRLKAYLRESAERVDPTLDEVIAVAADAGPSRLFRQALAEMTLHEWSRVLCVAAANASPSALEYVPVWTASAALLALGLGRAVDAFVSNVEQARGETARTPPPPIVARRPVGDKGNAIGDWLEGPNRRAHPPERSLLVVIGSAQAVAATWKPSPRGSALVLEPADMRALLVGPAAPLSISSFGHLVTDGLNADDPAVRELMATLTETVEKEHLRVERWTFDGIAEATRGVRPLPRTSLDAALDHVAAAAVSAAGLYLHALGRDADSVSAPLRNWLAQGQRRARGFVDLNLQRRLRWLLAWLIFGRLRGGVFEDAEYVSATKEAPSGTIPEEVSTVYLRRPGIAFTRTAKWLEAGPNVLVVKTSRYRVKFLASVQREGIRLESEDFRSLIPFGFRPVVLSLLRPGVAILIGVRERAFTVRVEFTLRGGVIAVILGNFAPETTPPPK